jgi:hypothetical protein
MDAAGPGPVETGVAVPATVVAGVTAAGWPVQPADNTAAASRQRITGTADRKLFIPYP